MKFDDACAVMFALFFPNFPIYIYPIFLVKNINPTPLPKASKNKTLKPLSCCTICMCNHKKLLVNM